MPGPVTSTPDGHARSRDTRGSDGSDAELDISRLLRAAISRDNQAEQRDRAAEARDTAAQQLTPAALAPSGSPATPAPGQASADRAQAGKDRDAAAGDRADLLDALRDAVRTREDAAAHRGGDDVDGLEPQGDQAGASRARDDAAAGGRLPHVERRKATQDRRAH